MGVRSIRISGKVVVRFIVLTVIRAILITIARVRIEGRSRIPAPGGALIIAMNHINFLELPAVYLSLRGHRVVAVAKHETWNTPVLRFLANVSESIPIRRGEVDTNAFDRVKDEIARGATILIAPEGTRSGHGRLQRANAGVVSLASRTGAAVLPLVHFGGEQFWPNIRRFRRTTITIRIGTPMRVAGDTGDSGRTDTAPAMNRQKREAELDRIMGEIAALLPLQYRGYYRDRIPV